MFGVICSIPLLPIWCLQSLNNVPCYITDIGNFCLSLIIFGDRNGNPIQHSCLENSMNSGAWHATVQGVTKNWTQLFLCVLKFANFINLFKNQVFCFVLIDFLYYFLFSILLISILWYAVILSSYLGFILLLFF